jgi:hypothetical protein
VKYNLFLKKHLKIKMLFVIMRYYCEYCEYITYEKSKYNKHIKSDKHRYTSYSIKRNIHNEQNAVNNQYMNNSIEIIKKTEENKYLQNENESLKKHILSLEHKNITLEQKIDKITSNLIDVHKNESTYLKSVVKNSVSALSYIMANYKNAPLLAKLDDYSIIHKEQSDSDFVMTITNEYNNGTLSSFLGKILIKFYKKDDSKSQSIWNTDISRLTFIIKYLSDNKDEWYVDKMGIKTIETIVIPLLDYIKLKIDNHVMQSNKNYMEFLNSHSVDEAIAFNTKLQEAVQLSLEFKNNTISKNIIKFIAPVFSFDKKLLQ